MFKKEMRPYGSMDEVQGSSGKREYLGGWGDLHYMDSVSQRKAVGCEWEGLCLKSIYRMVLRHTDLISLLLKYNAQLDCS